MRDGGEDRLAPVIPLFGDRMTRASELVRGESQPAPRPGTLPAHISEDRHRPVQMAEPSDPDDIAQHAEEALVRKLRARSLSVSEARQVLRGQGLDAAGIDDVIDRFCERGYLDDALLAEHLVISGIERKGQGRVALSRALAQRGVPRDVIDAALGDLPDDDAERALEFARTKARSLSRLDFDTALRRLMGQLARRGYGGSVAMTAARTALNEASLGGPTNGVRFVDSD
jgi:regulatory protein